MQRWWIDPWSHRAKWGRGAQKGYSSFASTTAATIPLPLWLFQLRMKWSDYLQLIIWWTILRYLTLQRTHFVIGCIERCEIRKCQSLIYSGGSQIPLVYRRPRIFRFKVDPCCIQIHKTSAHIPSCKDQVSWYQKALDADSSIWLNEVGILRSSSTTGRPK